MKRLVSMFICVLVAMAAVAQDIIITRDAQRIECLIQEVSSTEVKYKMWDNQTGPTFILTAQEINSIIFQNGTVKTFEAKQSVANQSLGENRIENYGNYYSLIQDGKETKMDRDAYRWFIKKNCPAAWQEYQKSTSMIKGGYTMLSIGVPLCLVVGLPMYFCCETYGGAVTGCVFMGIGAASAAISVPLLTVGYKQRNNNHNIYNLHCAGNSNCLSLNFQTSMEGMGLALTF
ncbi:MAG: hypothetical protein SOT07_04975 [Paludibacteraceae bacterium]|nr:hypothetical protein [Paludibacteraceae bacterium]